MLKSKGSKKKVDVVMIGDDNRPRLRNQTVRSLVMNSASRINLHFENPQGRGVGATKNAGAKAITRETDYVVFSDDDMYWLPGWDMWLVAVLKMEGPLTQQLGAWSHPFNHVADLYPAYPDNPAPTNKLPWLGEVNACHGGGFIMRWSDWDKFGGFVDNATGPGQSEDWELSQRIVKAGGRVRCIVPFVALHCGITNCLGEPATGAKEMLDDLERTIKVLGLEGTVIYG